MKNNLILDTFLWFTLSGYPIFCTFAAIKERNHAAVAQLVEHQLPKLRVAGSSPVCRSTCSPSTLLPHSVSLLADNI